MRGGDEARTEDSQLLPVVRNRKDGWNQHAISTGSSLVGLRLVFALGPAVVDGAGVDGYGAAMFRKLAGSMP